MIQTLLQRMLAGLVLAMFVVLLVVAPATAQDSTKTQTTGTVQTHAAETALQPGTIVRVSDKATSTVAPVAFDKASEMYGVVISPNNLPLTVTGSGLKNELYVATSGTYDVIVSTQNGPIKAGDYLTVSAIAGIAMAAEPEQKKVFGRAAGSFDGKTGVEGSVQLKDTGGNTAKQVALGRVPVAIDIRDNPQEKSTKANVPPVLQRLGEAIAEKPVSPVRMYLSIAITIISVIVAVVILQAGIRNALVSIGRNPLSKKSIIRALIEIIFTSLIILIVGLFAVYLLLKL